MTVVWKLDSLGRSLTHLVNTVQDLSTRGVGLRVLTGQGAQIDTTTAAGRGAGALIVAASAVGAIPYIGEVVTRVIANLVLFLGGAVVVVAVKSLFAVARD